MKTLIVDDAENIRYLLETLFKNNGYEVDTASNGSQALDMLRAGKYDLVISDILMPIMDGYQLCYHIRQDDKLKNILFVFLSAEYTEEKDEKFSLLLGADKFIRKPIDPGTLLATISNLTKEYKSGNIISRELEIEERSMLRLYSERLTKKLDQKILQLEDEILEKNKLLQAIEKSPVLIIMTDTDGNIEYVNPHFTKVTGYTFKEVEKQNPRILKSSNTTIETYEQMWNIIKSGDTWQGTWQNKKKDGELFWSKVLISSVKDENGSIINFMSIQEDITASYEAEIQLLESEEKYRTLFNEAPVGIIVVKKNIVQFVNPKLLQLYGYENEDDLIGQVADILNPDEIGEKQGTEGFGRKSGQPLESNYTSIGLKKDGTSFPIEVYSTIIHLIVGSATLAFVQDITDSHNAMKALKESELRYRTLFDNAPEAILIHDADTDRYVDANNNALDLFKIKLEDLLNISPTDLSAPIQEGGKSPEELISISKIETLEGKVSTIEWMAMDSEGRRFPAEIRLVKLPFTNRNLIRASVIDKREKKKADLIFKETEERYRLLVENAPEAILVFDVKQYKYIDANSNALDLFKIDINELSNITPLNLAAANQSDGRSSKIHLEETQLQLEKGGSNFVEWMASDLEGRIFPVDIRMVQLPSVDRNLIRISVVDISERKGKENELIHYTKELEKSQQKHSEAQKIGNLGHWDWNIKTDLLIWSDHMYRIFDVHPEEFEGTFEAFLNYIHLDDKENVQNVVNDALYNNVPYNIEHRIIIGDKTKFVNEIGAATFDDLGKPIRMVGTVQDITEKKRAEEELKSIIDKLAQASKSID